MIDLEAIPSHKEDLDAYEVDHLFHSWSFQPAQAPPRVVSAEGVRFTTEDGRERLDFSSCFVSHNIGHQDQRVVDAICRQARELTSFAPSMSTKPRALLGKMLAEITPGDLSRSFISLGGKKFSLITQKPVIIAFPFPVSMITLKPPLVWTGVCKTEMPGTISQSSFTTCI